MAASYFERDRQEVSPTRQGMFKPPLEAGQFDAPVIPQEKVQQIKEQGDALVALSNLGYSVRQGDEHFKQIQAIWSTFGVSLSLNPETGDVVFPGKQIDAVGQALIDTQYILYDHFDRGKGNPNTR